MVMTCTIGSLGYPRIFGTMRRGGMVAWCERSGGSFGWLMNSMIDPEPRLRGVLLWCSCRSRDRTRCDCCDGLLVDLQNTHAYGL